MSTVEYNLDESDLEAFFDHQARNSPECRRRVAIARWSLAGLYVLLALLAAYAERWSLSVAAAIGAALFAFFYPRYFRWSYRRGNLRVYQNSRNLVTLGHIVLTERDDELESAAEYGVSIFKLEAVERVESSDSHLFVYVGAAMALIVPKRKISSGDYMDFEQRLLANVAAAA